MKNLGKQKIHIHVNGAPNGKIQTKTVYENSKGEFFINDLSSKKRLDIINNQYVCNYVVKQLQPMRFI